MKATEIMICFPRILLVGDYGTGKTYFLGKLHKRLCNLNSKGLYLLDHDLGYPTLRSAKFDVETELFYDKDPRYPNAWEQTIERITEFEEDNRGYHFAAIDSLTSLHTAAMNYVISINEIKGRYIGRIRMANLNDFGVLVNIFGQFFPQLLRISLKMGFILTAHIREREHPVTKEVELFPAIAGKSLPSQIGDWFNEVWHIFIDNKGERIIQTRSGNRIDCKTQIAEMPEYLPVDEALNKLFIGYGLDNLQEERSLRETKADDIQPQSDAS